MSNENRRGSVEKPDLSVLGPMREIMRLVEIGKRTQKQLQAFVEGRNPFHTTADRAIEILGGTKVITRGETSVAFKYTREGSLPGQVRYTEETLRTCASSNMSNDFDWHLVYGLPLSFRQQREVVGTSVVAPYGFYDGYWWMDQKNDYWATSQPEAGYYLIDFFPRFQNMSWEEQSSEIELMGPEFERADERVFSQALLSIPRLQRSRRLYLNGFHWGRCQSHTGSRVYVGEDSLVPSLLVGHDRPERGHHTLFVCVARKWEL